MKRKITRAIAAVLMLGSLALYGQPAWAYLTATGTASAAFYGMSCNPVLTATGAPGSSVSFNPSTCTFTIPRGDVGAPGAAGATGPQGPQGPAGTNGTNGTNGVSGWERLTSTLTNPTSGSCTGGSFCVVNGSTTLTCTSGKKVLGWGFTNTGLGGGANTRQLVGVLTASSDTSATVGVSNTSGTTSSPGNGAAFGTFWLTCGLVS